jgi:all-trans-retinol 13,14-reductase
VVIGAGLGGLCCAVELARQGLEVCVLEQHDKPGGYAHGFRRKGYRFDVSLHHLGGLDEGALARGALSELGVLDKLELERRDHLLRLDMPGLDLLLPNDAAALEELLAGRFPAQRAGLARFFAELRQLKGHTTGPVADPDFDVPPAERLSTRWADRSLAELIDKHIDDPALQAVLGAPWPYIGLPPSQAAAGFGACVLGSTFLEGAWRLRGGGAALAQALVARLEELGGRCVVKAPVAEILVEDGKAAGVVLADGHALRAPVVVSNANPVQTYDVLAPEGAIPPRFLKLVQGMEPSVSFYALYLGLDCLPSAVGIEHDEHFVVQQADADRAWEALQAGQLERTDWSIASFERSDPQAAPAGGGVVTVMELTPTADWLAIEPEAYAQRKAAAEARILAKVLARFPKLADHVVVAEFATPRTMRRYTRNHAGAVYGWAQRPQQAGRKRLSNRAPLPGLFLTGAWTWAGGGYEGALMSGLQSADAVLLQHRAPAPAPRGRLVAAAADVGAGFTPARRSTPAGEGEPTAPPFPHRLPLQAFREALDHRGRVSPRALLRFLDRGRVEACENASGEDRDSWLRRWVVNVYRIDARFERPAGRGELVVHTGLRKVSSHRAIFDQQVRDGDGAVLHAGVEVTFQDPEQGLVPVPAGFAEGPAPAGREPLGLPPIPFGAKGHFRHHSHKRVYYEDTDAQGIVYHVTYLRWCEEQLEALLGPDAERAWIEALDIRYLEAARFADRLDIHLGARRPEGHRVAVDVRMIRADETVLADATLILAFSDDAGVPAALPEALARLVNER